MAIDEEKLNQHVQTAVNDFGATLHAPLVVIGDRLGLSRTPTINSMMQMLGIIGQLDSGIALGGLQSRDHASER